MANISSFKELRSAITKCCSAKQSNEVGDRYAFNIDMVKLENIFKQKKTDLHTFAFSKTIESHVPSYDDIQLVTEYMKTDEEINNTFNGSSEICSFMIYCKSTTEGVMEVTERDTPLTDKVLFNCCNGDELNRDIIFEIVKRVPIYRILVVREFNYDSDMFEYKIYIRSNYHMVNFFKQISSESKEESAE